MLKQVLIGAALTMSLAANASDDWLKSLPDFELQDQNGTAHTLDEYRHRDLLVFYVQGVGCPIARIGGDYVGTSRTCYYRFEGDTLLYGPVQNPSALVTSD